MPRNPDPVPLDPARILRALDAHGVAYLLIGGMAAVAHGAAYVTLDLDITPQRTAGNLDRLAAALTELGAALRVPGDPDPVPVAIDARTFGQMQTMTFRTAAGDLDVAFRPDGTGGYDDLNRRRVVVAAFGLAIPVAHLDDVIRSKEAAGREKDRLALPLLRRLQERLADPEL